MPKHEQPAQIKIEHRYPIAFACGAVIVHAVGYTLYCVTETRKIASLLAPWVLLIFGLLSFVPWLKISFRRFFAWGTAVFIAAMSMEILGVATGKIFGPYHYSSLLGQPLFGVPLIIGLNWMVVILGASSFAGIASKRFVPSAAIAGVLAMAFDIGMEPGATQLGYWSWQAQPIPIQNYLVWAVLGTLFSALHSLIMRPVLAPPRSLNAARQTSMIYLTTIFLYFIAIPFGLNC